jgi:3-oxoacyl-[acyl-carrier protein] reductase
MSDQHSDWSLDPRVRKVLQHMPLPVQLPLPLQRLSGKPAANELEGTRSVVTRLRDARDLAVIDALRLGGSAVACADAEAEPALLAAAQVNGVRHLPWSADLLTVVRESGAREDRRPVLLLHRVACPEAGAEIAVNRETDRLYQVGQAAALLPNHSRLVLLLGDELEHSFLGRMTAAEAAGMARSAHKEFGRNGTTVHVLRLRDVDPAGLGDAAAFFASPRAAFLTGLDVQLSQSVGSTGGDLDGKVALVTGAARGIGAAIARRLAAEGAHVFVNDIPQAEEAANQTVAALRSAGGSAEFVGADCASASGAAVIARAIGARGKIDAVIHNAGITRDRTLKKLSLDHWRLVMQVNLGAMVRVQDALAPLTHPGTSLVMMSSVMGIAGNFGQANYSASKAAVIALAREWAEAGRAQGLRANAVAPGFILTEMTAHLPLMNREMAKQLTAMLQPGLPDDVAELTAFLASPQSRAITGQVLRCDGGMAFGA